MNTSHLKKADGIEALVMGYPIPPLFCGIDFVAVVGSLSFTGFALLRQIRRYQNKKVAARTGFLFLGSRDGFRDCVIGGMNIDVTLWVRWARARRWAE